MFNPLDNQKPAVLILPVVPFVSDDEYARLSAWQKGIRHGEISMLNEIKYMLSRAGIDFREPDHSVLHRDVPVRYQRYESVSEKRWQIMVTSISYINHNTGERLADPDVIFMYESDNKNGEMALSEFKNAYRLLTPLGGRRRKENERFSNKLNNNLDDSDKDDYHRYL